MICPECQGKSRVIDSRVIRLSHQRRRECKKCGYRWSTFEIVSKGDEYPYPVCNVLVNGEPCAKPARPSCGLLRCKKHYAEYQKAHRSGERFREKDRQRRKARIIQAGNAHWRASA
jgi:hypothetical protein